MQAEVLRAQRLGQDARQPEADRACLAVDDDGRDAVAAQPQGGRVRLAARGVAAVGDHDQQRPAERVTQPLAEQRGVGLGEPGGQRGLPSGGHALQPARGGVHRRGGRQQQLRAGAAEADEAHLVAALVGVEQQREHGALDRFHPAAGGHRPAGVHQEQDQVGLPPLAAALAQVGAFQDQAGPGPAAADLVRRAGHQGRGQVHVPQRGPRRAGADGMAAVGVGARAAPGGPVPLAGDLEPPRAERRAGRPDRLASGRGPGRLVPAPSDWLRAGSCAAWPSAGAGASSSAGPGRGGCGSGSSSGPPPASPPSASSSCCSSRPGASNGLRRRRCGSASRDAARMSSRVTAAAPRQAAWAAAARAITMSARSPSTPKLAHTAAICSSAASSMTTAARRARAAAIEAATADSSLGEPRRERLGIGVEGDPPADDLGPGRRVARRGRLDGQAEPVKQLRPQLAFLGVHGADQQEPGRVLYRYAVALHVAGPEGGRVEQQVDEVVVQQVDLVDVQDAPVRRGQQSRLEGGDTLGERAPDVQRAGEPVFGGADRQLHQPGRARLRRAPRPGAGRLGTAGRVPTASTRSGSPR